MEWTTRRLNTIIETCKFSTYLELGVSSGDTYREIDCNSKVGVDPFFRFDWRNYEEAGAELYEITSDDFFSQDRDRQFDCIFIDGLHTFEQTLRDLINAMEALKPGGAILIDDTVPIDAFSAMRSQSDAVIERKKAGLQGQFWHGDVYKLLFFLHDFYRSWDFTTIIGSDNPQTLVWNRGGVSRRSSICNRISEIDDMTFETFRDMRANLPECSEAEALARFFSSFR
ncbi:class I SAM-dependent methyltransferase [Roseicyclus mahoneyensis]|jgi:hypothetical protein|uniref:Methyltransferase family protein n=1 Tax=Roseicyclus mahoneyensis TaxID=164332 RepID=A0A316GDU4_9RHOB|nr:class I SAM-dependent methyltransferase [Roseicyclus mahoneyensis]PWK59104.1 methyltransferase family protein [Roseicyclus mahoneyensis]